MHIVPASDFHKGLERLDADTLSLLSFHLSSNDHNRARSLIQMISAGTGMCNRNACANCPLSSCWEQKPDIDWQGLAGEVDEIIDERASAGLIKTEQIAAV